MKYTVDLMVGSSTWSVKTKNKKTYLFAFVKGELKEAEVDVITIYIPSPYVKLTDKQMSRLSAAYSLITEYEQSNKQTNKIIPPLQPPPTHLSLLAPLL